MVSSRALATNESIRVAILMACHNRATTTSNFFRSFKSADKHNFNFEFYVTDDGSTDETSEILLAQELPMKIILKDGTLFWAKSMAVAEQSIERVPDGILWVNDDIVLKPEAFKKLYSMVKQFPSAVLVGQILNPDSNRIIYGGYHQTGIHPLRLSLIESFEDPIPADTFNGNFVYIPTEIRLAVGSIDGNFQHAFADCDYGARVKKLGYPIYVIPGVIADGLENAKDLSLSRIRGIRIYRAIKNSPDKSRFRYFKKHLGFWGKFLIPILMILPYLRIIIFGRIQEEKISS